MTTFDAIRRACGLTQAEAAELFGVALSTVKHWCSGRRGAPEAVLAELAAIEARMERAADEALALAASHPEASPIELGAAHDDAEAQALGWATASLHAALLGRVAARLIQRGHRVTVVPRGTSVASAVAADVHDARIAQSRS